jgi:hypothetical protein
VDIINFLKASLLGSKMVTFHYFILSCPSRGKPGIVRTKDGREYPIKRVLAEDKEGDLI